ncbi:hypothetical protein C2R22_10790 [Salinigranum rubrum]|uniref:DUF4365 domain-containing protein n=2 Tax=Salinigranum rubrum TaxID=755307 RepID=A0A2I8VJI7_9EURY|nr:hypothetical protein C2R22_10790 [Salinigranum rubrum]
MFVNDMDDDRDSKKPEAAPYPPSDEAEQRAVNILEDILDPRVKSHIDSRDKTPNHDGHLELVNDDGVPEGRVVVQIKKLHDDNRDDPKVKMETRHLAYCFTSNEPFIIILVDTTERAAYWSLITETWYEQEGLSQQQYKVVRPDSRNLISRTTDEYVDEWLKYANQYKSSHFKLDKPPAGVLNWGHRLNMNFEKIGGYINDFGTKLGISGLGDYEKIEQGMVYWHIPVNDNFEKIENEVTQLAKMVNVDHVGDYRQPSKGQLDWHYPLNYNFFKIEMDLESLAEAIRDQPQ